MSGSRDFETVIGLEIHAQLATASKLFSSAPVDPSAESNRAISPVCLGLPGTLPVPNIEALRLAVKAASALGCEVHQRSVWARKQYFYPDLSKGYQITQFAHPYATGGGMELECEGGPRFFRLTRIHMEEDAGKSLHDRVPGKTLVDYNRAGTPLIEIVTEPDFRTASEVSAFLKHLRTTLRYIGACDGNMERGNFRCDANVSLRPRGVEKLGTRCEIKNLNSFRFVEAAITYETARQARILSEGGEVVQETRLWDEQKEVTRGMRSKEEAHDYRYFPDPDLPPLVIDDAKLAAWAGEVGELPHQKIQRWRDALGVDAENARILGEEGASIDFFEAALEGRANHAPDIAKWLVHEVTRFSSLEGLEACPLEGAWLGDLVEMIATKEISGKIGKRVLQLVFEEGIEPRALVDKHGLKPMQDEGALRSIVEEIWASHPAQAEDLRGGKEKLRGFFVGKVMAATQGKADPAMVQALLDQLVQQG